MGRIVQGWWIDGGASEKKQKNGGDYCEIPAQKKKWEKRGERNIW